MFCQLDIFLINLINFSLTFRFYSVESIVFQLIEPGTLPEVSELISVMNFREKTRNKKKLLVAFIQTVVNWKCCFEDLIALTKNTRR